MTGCSVSSFHLRLPLLVLLVLLPVAGLILYTAAEQRHIAAGETQKDALWLARVAAMQEERLIEGARQLLLVLAQLPEVQRGDSAGCSALFAEFLARYPSYANFGAITARGEVFCSALPFRGPLNVAHDAYFQRALQTRDFAIGDYQVSRFTGEPNVIFASPVLDEAGQVQAIVIATLHFSWLKQLAATVQLPAGAILLVIDDNGKVLSYYPDAERWLGRSVSETPLLRAILAQQGQGVTEAPGLDSIPRFFGFTPLTSAPGATNVYVSSGIPTARVFAEANRMLVRNLIGLGMIAVVAFVGTWLGGAWPILRQVRALKNATRRLSAGDLSARTGLPNSTGELSQLARDFDTMAEALQKRQTEVEQVWSALREKLQVSVALAEELRRSNRLKSDFLATLVHELRTPLNIILGYIDLLVEESSGPLTSEQADILQRVEWAARELVELITATLAISRLEAGQLPVERQEVKVPEVIEELKQETARLREQSGLNFVWQMEPHLPLLYTDRTKLKIVLKNLIRNALKYTDEGKVSVNICARDEGVEFGVSDTGVGIRPEVLPVIFEMFRQAHQVGTRQYEGSGLGLYIVQRMLELLEGTITVESEVGRGSTFRAWVPVKGDSGKEPLLTEA